VGVGDQHVGTVAEFYAAVGRLKASGCLTATLTFDGGGGNPLQREVLERAHEAALAASSVPQDAWLSSHPPPPPPLPGSSSYADDIMAGKTPEKGAPHRRRSWWQMLIGSGKKGKPAGNRKQQATPGMLDYRARIIAIYEHHGLLEKAAKVDGYMAKYQGKEEGMIAILVKKYGPEPSPQRFQRFGQPSRGAQQPAAPKTPSGAAAGADITATTQPPISTCAVAQEATPRQEPPGHDARRRPQASEAATPATPAARKPPQPRPPLRSDPVLASFASSHLAEKAAAAAAASPSKENLRAMLAARRNSDRDEKELSRLWSMADSERSAGELGDELVYLDGSEGMGGGDDENAERSMDFRDKIHGDAVTNPVSTLHANQPPSKAVSNDDDDGGGGGGAPSASSSAGSTWVAPSFGFGALEATAAGLSAASTWAVKAATDSAPEIELERSLRALAYATGRGTPL